MNNLCNTTAGDLLELTLNSVQFRFRFCPAGTFTMGNGRNAHKVTLTQGFWMGETQVTQIQWKTVMGWNMGKVTQLSDFFRSGTAIGRIANPSRFVGDNLPVDSVGLFDYLEFIKMLDRLCNQRASESANALAAVSGYCFALPTEAQWEYACRAGSTAKYYFGNDESQLDDYAWYDKNSGGETHDVGTKKPNAWNLFDMYGNVWEWCADWYASYPKMSLTDPIGASSGCLRVIRGGSYNASAGTCRSAYRDRVARVDGYDSLGLRIALVKDSK